MTQQTLQQLLTERISDYANSDRPRELIDAGIDKMFQSVVDDLFRSYGDFTKVVKEAMSAAMPANVSDVFELTKYNAMVASLLRQRWEQAAVESLVLKTADKAISEVLTGEGLITGEVSLKALLQSFVDAHKEEAARDHWSAPEIRFEEDTRYGSTHLSVYFDPEPEDEYRGKGYARSARNDFASETFCLAPAGTLRATDGGSDVDHAMAGHLVAGTLQSSGKAAGSATQQDAEAGLLVVHGTQDPDVLSNQAHPLGRNHGQENAILAFSCKDCGSDLTSNLSPTLRAMGRGDSHANGGDQVAVALIQNATRGKDQNGLGVANGREPMYTLDQASQHAVFAIQAGALRTNPLSGPDGVGVQADHAYTLEARAEVQAVCVTGDIAHTLKADGYDGSEDGTGRGQPIVSVALRGRDGGATAELGDDVAGTLRASQGGGDKPHALISSAVRRLTPKECERLQGFPDDYTLIPWRGKPAEECPDGPRYKAIGNSKAVPVVRWIGQRIKRHLELQSRIA